ncbi:threonine synthase [Pedobacter yulinensis]|uniref:Threonine synthase n=1 Tax=Pedobacter yulinensis TaxID=2126353 RepID=A0A2T3HP57_9SPHI|nr:threonine synthase [Pedobacter yulinensis]PST84238.1 threonine synthase [Pedobacter yulinensis]
MKFYSTNNKDLRVGFEEAVFNSMPADKGLYMPEHIPRLDAQFISKIDQHSLPDIAFRVASALLGDDIAPEALRELVTDAINFDAPLVPLDQHTAVLELFHGPSLAFKDFGARFMSRVMGHYLREGQKQLDVLVATSGDTGGAVALGFLGVPGTRVTILFPRGKVSPIQELQLVTNGQNIRAIEVEGTFDDCQALVKQAFADPELNAQLRLTSANSINIARLIPQTFYYFHAYAQVRRAGGTEIVFSVPSGNFGNIGAGLLAMKMGLPVKGFVAATNLNDTVPRFLESGVYEARPSVQTYANAMDVGAPSNWVRIMDLFGGDLEAVRRVVHPARFSDAETVRAMAELADRYDYIACPHTAIAWLGAEQFRKEQPGDYHCVFLSTAHPCKFPEVFSAELAARISTPEQLNSLAGREGKAFAMPADFNAFKTFLTASE